MAMSDPSSLFLLTTLVLQVSVSSTCPSGLCSVSCPDTCLCDVQRVSKVLRDVCVMSGSCSALCLGSLWCVGSLPDVFVTCFLKLFVCRCLVVATCDSFSFLLLSVRCVWDMCLRCRCDVCPCYVCRVLFV